MLLKNIYITKNKLLIITVSSVPISIATFLALTAITILSNLVLMVTPSGQAVTATPSVVCVAAIP